ncbi:MAG: TlpA family protein disulfide reductase [Bacteroidota bacterium]|nr:TlpA family protein disulfide reductase [Bacteroidota bacterium]
MKQVRNIGLFLLFISITISAFTQEIPKWKVKDLETFIKDAKQPTIINFWATFCKPCLEELPYIQSLQKKYENAGVQLLLVSLDMSEAFPAKIKSVANKQKLKISSIVFLNETDADLFCPVVDKSWSGAIPASLFINNKKGYRKFYEEQLTKEIVEKEITNML